MHEFDATLWSNGREKSAVIRVDNGTVLGIEPTSGSARPTRWSVLPGFVDHHVHLGLVAREQLAGGALVEVHDLGWSPLEALRFRDRPPGGVQVRVAGPFHTAVDGYPSGQPWAPGDSIRAVANPSDVRRAVEDAVRHGFDYLKVVLHSGAPTLSDELLELLVETTHAAGLPAVVHAEGPGQAAWAIGAGADVLVHAPWTEEVPDEVLEQGVAMTWISTLSIHAGNDRAVAIDNVRRFLAHGGTVRYGTDMGNGPTPVAVSPREIQALGEAGLSGNALLAALTGDPSEHLRSDRLLASPHPVPSDAHEVIAWLKDSHRLSRLTGKEIHV